MANKLIFFKSIPQQELIIFCRDLGGGVQTTFKGLCVDIKVMQISFHCIVHVVTT
jgi:hypothetical protein